MQNIINEELYKKYSRVIITRSDFLWLGNHANPILIKNRNQLFVPEASDWGGLSDRWYYLIWLL
jgi:hypothetical protein